MMVPRHSERIAMSLPVLIQADGTAPAPGVIRNLSTGGMFVQTRGAVALNSRVVVTLDLSRYRQTPRHQLAGVVVHEQPGGVGLCARDMEMSLRDAVLHCAGFPEPPHGLVRWFVTESAAPPARPRTA